MLLWLKREFFLRVICSFYHFFRYGDASRMISKGVHLSVLSEMLALVCALASKPVCFLYPYLSFSQIGASYQPLGWDPHVSHR